MISSVGSYDVTPLSAEKSNSALVAIGWPISRLEPCPMISSGCSLAIAARTACSTSLASRIFRVSTPSVSRFPHDLLKWRCLSQPSDHPSKAVAERHKGELSGAARGRPSTGWVAGSRADVIPSHRQSPVGLAPPRSPPTPSPPPLSKHFHAQFVL